MRSAISKTAIRIILIVVGVTFFVAGCWFLYLEKKECDRKYYEYLAVVKQYETELKLYEDYRHKFKEWTEEVRRFEVMRGQSYYAEYPEPPAEVEIPKLPSTIPSLPNYTPGWILAAIGTCLLIVSSLRYFDRSAEIAYEVKPQGIATREIIPDSDLVEAGASAIPYELDMLATDLKQP